MNMCQSPSDQNFLWATSTKRGEEVHVITRIRDRDRVISKLLPKVFGIIAQLGHSVPGYGHYAASVGEDVIITGVVPFCSDRAMLSIYNPVSRSDVMKVFSANVSSVPQFGGIAFYRYWDNHVGILSWRRGGWEELIVSQETASLAVSEAFARRIFCPCPVH
jgi:hypothetical protein